MNPSNENPDDSNPYSAPQSGVQRTSDGEQASLASLGQRLGAAIVDGGLMVASVFGPAIAGGDWEAIDRGLQSGDPEQMAWVMSGCGYAAAPILVVALIIFQVVLLLRDGQTIGKRLVGSRIVRVSGERVGVFRILVLRAWVPSLFHMLPGIGMLLWVADVALIFRPSRRCLHDYLADTKVIRD